MKGRGRSATAVLGLRCWLCYRSLCAEFGEKHCSMFSLQIERILGVRLQAGLRAWTQVLLGQAEDKAEVDMDTDAPQVSHKPGGEPKIKVGVFPVADWRANKARFSPREEPAERPPTPS